jgi:uncharacterized repeat protein (TIGR04138 family)
MKKIHFDEAVNMILAKDPRYDPHAYQFVSEALPFTVQMLGKPQQGPGRHVSGGELLEGIRQFALQEFGPLARTVLAHWGVTRCEDFGNLVFNMVSIGLLGKTDDDRLEDFAGGYSFEEAFTKPFQPTGKAAKAAERSKAE